MATPKKTGARVQFVWGHVCSMSSIDQQRNNISLFNVIEQMNFPSDAFELSKREKKPVLVPNQHEVVVMLRKVIDPILSGEKEELIDIKLGLIDSGGMRIFENLQSIKLPPNIRRYRHRFYNAGFPVTKPGNYVYTLEIREPNQESFGVVNEIPLEIKSV